MKNIAYYDTMSREGWGEGPWKGEADKEQWPDADTGLPCLVVRNSLGALCGYVGVAPDHPLHGMRYVEIDGLGDVWHGLTFSGPCSPDADEETGICHVPEEGEPHDVWWFGFDCGHHLDVTPGSNAELRKAGWSGVADGKRDHGYVERFESPITGEMIEWVHEYRTLPFVKSECRKLAAALREASEATITMARRQVGPPLVAQRQMPPLLEARK